MEISVISCSTIPVSYTHLDVYKRQEHYKDIQNLDFHLLIDGKEVQRGCTADMLFKTDDIIAYVSQFVTLRCV